MYLFAIECVTIPKLAGPLGNGIKYTISKLVCTREAGMAEQGGLQRPPSGVPSEPTPDRPYIPLKDAARLLHLDRRTLQASLLEGRVQGWARPGPRRLRWFVYEDQVSTGARSDASGEVARLRSEVAELRAELAQVSQTLGSVADLRAQVVTLTETNLLLLGAQEELGTVASAMDRAVQNYREALGLFMTPGHPGALTAPTPPLSRG